MISNAIKKEIIIVIIFVCLLPIKSFARNWNGWIYQDPYPTSNTLLAVKFISPQKGWVAGENGTILATEDGGDTWDAQESGTEHFLSSIFFINDKIGWAVGVNGTIIHTSDGGKSWITQYKAETESALLKGFFVNEREGWVIGREGALHTTDGGKHWVRRDGLPGRLSSIFFIDSRNGWALAGNTVYRTTDGGLKWDTGEIPSSGYSFMAAPGNGGMPPIIDWVLGDIYFMDAKNGWAVSGYGGIFRTNDGGKTWTKAVPGSLPDHVNTLSFFDAKRGCVAGSSILCTEDSGKTWDEKLGIKPRTRKRIDEYLVDLQAISIASGTTAFAVGNDGQIWKTENGGKSWKLAAHRDECGRYVFFLNNNTGWFYYRGDYSLTLCRTDDGGRTRQKQDVGMNVLGLFFIDDSKGWAVGTIEERNQQNKLEKVYGVIKHTIDGGRTWATQFKELRGTSRFGTDLFSVYFLDANTGWVAGSAGLILHTRDGGNSWEKQKSGSSQFDLQDIRFLNHQNGWIAGIKYNDGWTGVILRTDDGGNQWKVQYSMKKIGFTSLFFIDNRSGWAIAEAEQEDGPTWIFHTGDAGHTWKKEKLGYVGDSNPIFLDKKRGVIDAEKGWIITTADGGKTWEKIRKPIRKIPWHFSEVLSGGLL